MNANVIARDVALPGPVILAADPSVRAMWYRRYVLAVIWIVMLFRFVDIQIISVLMESIKKEFQFSDTQMGLLGGTAFALFYGTLGIPLAWCADRYNRRNILAAAVGLWSAMTALTGLATGFATLFLARLGVGVGEAGGQAPAYSLIADYTPPHRRVSTLAILSSAVPVGVFAGLLIGGVINHYYGWRAAFFVVGIPGVLVALLVRLTVREPRRGASDSTATVPEAKPLLPTIKELWDRRAYRHLVFATTIFTMGAVGSGMWIASYFIRVHGMDVADTSRYLAFIYGGGGLVGVLGGGYLAELISRRTGDARWPARIAATAAFCILPFSFIVYLADNPVHALLFQVATATLMHAWMGPAYGTIQNLASVRSRAVAAAVNLLAINLVAFGLGPLLVGAVSDLGAAWFGADSLRYAILAVVVISYTWAGVHFALASRTLREDLASAARVTA